MSKSQIKKKNLGLVLPDGITLRNFVFSSFLAKLNINLELSKSSDYPGCLMAFEKLNYKLVSRSKNNSHYEHFTRGK